MTASEREEARAAGRCYHGGAPALAPGDAILPAVATGVASFGGSSGSKPWPPDFRRHRVYMTVSSAHAECYARAWPGGGAVYRVEPADVHDDPEEPSGLSYWTLRATIVEVVIPKTDAYFTGRLARDVAERRRLPSGPVRV